MMQCQIKEEHYLLVIGMYVGSTPKFSNVRETLIAQSTGSGLWKLGILYQPQGQSSFGQSVWWLRRVGPSSR